MDCALAANLTAEVADLRVAVAALAGPSQKVSQAELLWNLAGALVLSLIINSCFFVAELGTLVHRVPHGRLVDAYAHILTGPIAFIAFIDGRSFAGTFVFFFALWHFLCHTGRGCPSYILAGVGKTRYEAWWWFECFLICVHHTYIGAGKLAFDLGYFGAVGNDSATLSDKVIYAAGMKLWLGGACFVHLSMGMKLLSIRGSVMVRILSTSLRFGGQALLIATQTGAIRAGMLLDMAWLVLMITTLLTFPKQPVQKRTPVDEPAPQSCGLTKTLDAPDNCQAQVSDVAESVASHSGRQRIYSDLYSDMVDAKLRLRVVQRAMGPLAVLANDGND